MKSIQKINVDISRDRNLSEPSVYAKQNDSNSREVEVTLCDNGVQLSSLTTTGKVFFGKGANAYGEAIEISNGVTEFTIPQNALSSPGRIQAEILILNADDDTETLTSASFAINCRTQINPSGSIDGENNGDYIEQIVDDLQSQIDALGGVDVSELQADIENLQSQINRLDSNTLDAVERLNANDVNLQSQIDALGSVDVSEIQSQLDNKSDATNLVNGSAEGSLRGVNTREEDSTFKMGENAVSLGEDTIASGNASHAEGAGTHALGDCAHAEGFSAHDIFLLTGSAKSKTYTVIHDCDSLTSHGLFNFGRMLRYGEQYAIITSVDDSTSTITTSETLSYSEDLNSAEVVVYLGAAGGMGAHTEGDMTTAYDYAAHSEGRQTYAVAPETHAEGYNTIAASRCQHTQGQNNIIDTSEKYVHIVGNGIDPTNRSNAHTLDWDGNAWFAGDVIVGGTSQDDENAIKLTDISNTTADLQSQITAEIASRQSADTNLQSQINAKATREVAIVGSDDENSAGWYKVADGTMPALNDVSMLFAVHSTVTNKQYAGILQLNLRSATSNITCPQFGWLVRNGFEDGQVIVTTDGLNWAMYFKVTSPRYYRTFFEVLQKSDRINSALKNYNLYTNSTVETTAPTATFASTDLGSVHQAIADLTARIEALENSASGGTITRTLLIDWDVNTNGSTQGTVSKDADGLHASGSTSIRIANYWSNNVSAYDGITFTAFGSGKLRVEVGGVEGRYVALSTTPTTFTFDFAENGLTDLSSVEINLQTQGVYDLTVSDIYGYTKS